MKQASWFMQVMILVALGATNAHAGDLTLRTPSITSYDWTGWYVGGHLGYGFGSSGYVASQPNGVAASGQTNLTNAPDVFKGSGSFLGGMQGGYNVVLPSRLMLGIEADASFSNLVAGASVATSLNSSALYGDTMLHTGTVRGRLGYVATNNWLWYGTGGFAWSYDQITRSQLTGGPLAPGTDEAAFVWRLGWAAGAGVEVPVAPDWTARAEYLYTGFDARNKTFAATPEVFSSDLSLHQIRLGLNYKLFNSAPAEKNTGLITKARLNIPVGAADDIWAVHGQTTFVQQYAAPFRAPYRGANSLASNAGRETFDATAYIGLRLWDGAEAWVNPEIDQGFGLSNTLGLAGFSSGEAYKKGADYPYTRIHRAFVRQTIDLGGDVQKVDAGLNQFAVKQTADRLVFTVGKFGIADVFDTNKYAHDPRTDFLNWSVIDTGSFDYAAEAWGYTLGAAAEWYQGNWTVRGGLFDMPLIPQGNDLDPRFGQSQWVGEVEHRHQLWGQPGKVAVTAFLSRARIGRFSDAIALAQITGGAANISAVREYRSRGGIGVNLEQQIFPDLGVFARAGVADGNVEPSAFTDIDRTVAAGLSLKGDRWGRPDDTVGLAGVLNGITAQHQAFLNAGGLGILVGDGQLPRPGVEQILETYYSFPVSFARMTLDYQLIGNPAYNRERGPVSIFSTRLRAAF